MLIIGTGGHALDSLDVFDKLKRNEEICFYNDVDLNFNFDNDFYDQFKILRSELELTDHFNKNPHYILGVGNPLIREKLDLLMKKNGGIPFNLISPNSTVGKINNSLGDSISIMNGVVVTINTTIGNGVLVNTNATLTHDTTIEDYVEIGPGVTIAGNCTVRHHAFIGSGATILPKITIGEHAIVAAGAVVTKNVEPFTMVAGNPAVFKKSL